MSVSDPYAHAFDIDLERAVLSVLFDGRYVEAVAILTEICPTPDHFFAGKHQLIARTIASMASTGQRVDSITIRHALQQVKFQDAITDRAQQRAWRFEEGLDARDSLYAHIGEETLQKIGEAFGPVAGFRTNCHRLADFRRQRALIAALLGHLETVTGSSGCSKAPTIGDALINDVSQVLGGGSLSITMEDAMGSALKRHDAERGADTKRTPATWGVDGLDRIVPLRRGSMIVLAASTGCGKTSLALQAVERSTALLGAGSCAIISREQDSDELACILIARTIKVGMRSVENGWLNPDQRARAEEVRQAWGGTDIAIRGTAGKCSAEDACAWIRQRHLRSGGKLALVVLDYLQLLDPSNHRQTPFDKLSNATRMLKLLCIELRITILLLSSMNRDGRKAIRDTHTGKLKSTPEPRREDLAGSGSIEADADAIVFIWTIVTEPTAQLPVYLKVDKNRKGSEGTCEALFDKANGQVFRDMVKPGTPSTDPADSSRKHHAHPPSSIEDKFAEANAAAAEESEMF